MSASLYDFPSISLLIAELNGERPGISLYDIVSKHCAWNILPHVDKGLSAHILQFDGGSGDDLVATYTATILHPSSTTQARQSPSEDHLIVTWKETSSQKFQIICRSKRGDPSTTLVQAYVRRGNNVFPVWGDPHPDAEDGELRSGLRKGTFLAARMYLAMAIDWKKEIFRGLPSSLEAIENRYATFSLFTEKNW